MDRHIIIEDTVGIKGAHPHNWLFKAGSRALNSVLSLYTSNCSISLSPKGCVSPLAPS